ncbi:MAG: thymidine kinase, partial [Phycisphaerae bacterium]|nr:thymidine kinase [candidate division Zixibacteria bacterium]NIU11044.1 thymidine kinase [Phycisphaerae bacterium]NIW41658.1 thymidine kinase [candidate division Zixibacteria bacterium]
FTKTDRRILIIGPMGSGKSEFSARIYRDSEVAMRKSEKVRHLTTSEGVDRRNVFYIRSKIDDKRFAQYPANSIAYRGGYVVPGNNIASIEDSFELEKVFDRNPTVGTWIIDEVEFFDERIAYVINQYAKQQSLNFIFPMLILNFRKDLFNRTARLIMEESTDVFPLTAYCENSDCIADSYYTYRFYSVAGVECPALYFDPLIIVGGDRLTDDPKFPNYSTRCDHHHYLPGKEYTFMILKPLGELAYGRNVKPLLKELKLLKHDIERSQLYNHFIDKFINTENPQPIMMNALKVSCIAEKALIYLFSEENIISAGQMQSLAQEIKADIGYINERLMENRKMQLADVEEEL